jgi:hypothetical protein
VEHVEVADAPVYQHGADFLEPQVPGQCLAAGDPLGQLQLGKERQLVRHIPARAPDLCSGEERQLGGVIAAVRELIAAGPWRLFQRLVDGEQNPV